MYRKKSVPSTYYNGQRNLILYFEKLSAILNYVWKTDLQF